MWLGAFHSQKDLETSAKHGPTVRVCVKQDRLNLYKLFGYLQSYPILHYKMTEAVEDFMEKLDQEIEAFEEIDRNWRVPISPQDPLQSSSLFIDV